MTPPPPRGEGSHTLPPPKPLPLPLVGAPQVGERAFEGRRVPGCWRPQWGTGWVMRGRGGKGPLFPVLFSLLQCPPPKKGIKLRLVSIYKVYI